MLVPGTHTMEVVGKTKWMASAAIAFLMTIQPGQAQLFNYTTALSGWTESDSSDAYARVTTNKYPSAQARVPHYWFLRITLVDTLDAVLK